MLRHEIHEVGRPSATQSKFTAAICSLRAHLYMMYISAARHSPALNVGYVRIPHRPRQRRNTRPGEPSVLPAPGTGTRSSIAARSGRTPDHMSPRHERNCRVPASAVKCAGPAGAAGRLTGMAQSTKEHVRRERLREYEAALAVARSPVGVLVLLAKGRELRAGGEALEESFAATPVEGIDDDNRLPAAVWVALRQGDVDATIEALVRVSRHEFVIAAHEELDSGYRLTTVEECRALPDVELLQAQVAAFLQVPRDVVVIIASWGPDDPRTAAEIDTLFERRFGSATPSGSDPAAASASSPRAGLVMSSAEFTAMLNLTPEQRGVLATLVRQADITLVAGGEAGDEACGHRRST